MKRKFYGTIRFFVAAVFLAMITAAIAGPRLFAWFPTLQPGPLWVRLAMDFTMAGCVPAVTLLAATFLFGRFFCAVLCPLGSCQDIVGLIRPNRKTRIANLRIVRYAVATLSLVLLAGGWAVAFRVLDPFSRYSAVVGFVTSVEFHDNGMRLTSGVMWNVLVPLFFLFGMVMWKRRFYCVSLCPIGTILGVTAKYGMGRMRIQQTCTNCGLCEAVCPTRCIDSATKSVDAERCVLCLQCVSACDKGKIAYGFTAGVPTKYPETGTAPDGSRRRFLLAGSALALGAIMVGRGFSHAIRGAARAAESVGNRILPPGAIGSERFARQCTGCQACTANCPAGIIRPSPHGVGPVGLDYSKNGCEYDCIRCSAVCPTGALRPLDLVEKQWLKIGEARVNLSLCRIVKDGMACGLCATACPKNAIFMVDGPNGFGVPEVAAFHCIGCGMCRAACPAAPKAISVRAIEQQPIGA